MKFRAWNFVMIQTPDHVIQIPIASIWPACKISVQIYSRENQQKIVESREIITTGLLNCGNYDTQSLNWQDYLFAKEGDFSIEVIRLKDGNLKFAIDAQSINFSAEFIVHDQGIESQVFFMPLSDDMLHYFTTKKTYGILTDGSYKYQDKEYQCNSSNKDCLTLYDNARGHLLYDTKWIWAIMNAYLPEYDMIVAFNFQDGIGSSFNPDDGNKFMEDFVLINGKHYKIDQVQIEYEESNIMQPQTFSTIKDLNLKIFKNRECQVKFTPLGVAEDGIHLIVYGITQNLVYGLYSGSCNIDGWIIQFKDQLGVVEHLNARW
ncbi:UNKNOWN [Stylonychia lemnae]|uniref:Uncharacterized protein n=1 Tax=Stylonychia lemnae TaxID=5949 RepID=A0A078AQ17_STYLE|nr:UNKNOWN [Stylonychia lemnae]|eukprot:CDW84455.1 UNKNOWN [Stylonychia lemnae]